MSNKLLPNDETKIREKLNSLGYDDSEEVFETAHQFKISDGARQLSAIEMDDFGPPDDTRFNLVFIQNPSNNDWVAYSLEVTFQGHSIIQADDLVNISHKYDFLKGPIPTKVEATHNLSIAVDKMKIQHLLKTDHRLKDAFRKIGFDDVAEMVAKATIHLNLAFLKKDVAIDMHAQDLKGLVTFDFIVVFPRDNNPPHIALVTTRLSTMEGTSNHKNVMRSKTFIGSGRGLPTIKTMFDQLTAGISVKPDTINKARKMFNIGDGSPPGQRASEKNSPKRQKK